MRRTIPGTGSPASCFILNISRTWCLGCRATIWMSEDLDVQKLVAQARQTTFHDELDTIRFPTKPKMGTTLYLQSWMPSP